MFKRVKLMVTIVVIVIFLFSVINNIVLFYPVYAQNNNNIAKLAITNGVASGDVTDHSAVIWSRANTQAHMHVQYDTNSHFSHPKSITAISVNQTTDFAGHVKLNSLSPNTIYYYRVWFTNFVNNNNESMTAAEAAVLPITNSMTGTFRTAPDHLTNRPVSFIVGGDLGGQSYCRRMGEVGYPTFSIMQALSPDFFLFNGDQIYGDDTCKVTGPSNVTGWYNIPGNFPSITDSRINWTNETQLQDVYNKHWEYNRADPHLQALLRNTSMYSQADDHEVANDYGGKWSYWTSATKGREGFPNVVKAGISAFFNFSPIDRNNENPNRIYRSFNWGKDLDLFILDAHSYRSRTDIADTQSNNKTLLGEGQLRWLEQGLLNSKATWKIVSSDVPITIPSCFNKESGCDNWATINSTYKKNYVRERSDLLKFLDDHNIKNIVFVTTDVHFPTNVVVDEDPNHDKHNLIFHEMVSGPISAIPLKASLPDPTINATSLYRESKIFNFEYIKIQKEESDDKVHLVSKVIDENGLLRPGSELDLTPQ